MSCNCICCFVFTGGEMQWTQSRKCLNEVHVKILEVILQKDHHHKLWLSLCFTACWHQTVVWRTPQVYNVLWSYACRLLYAIERAVRWLLRLWHALMFVVPLLSSSKPRRSQMLVEASPESWSKQKPQKPFGQTAQSELVDELKPKVGVHITKYCVKMLLRVGVSSETKILYSTEKRKLVQKSTCQYVRTEFRSYSQFVSL